MVEADALAHLRWVSSLIEIWIIDGSHEDESTAQGSSRRH
jgi:hypothetical protein